MSLYTIYDRILLMFIAIGHALRRQTAGQFGPDLAKKLSQLVKMEKNVMRSMEQVGRERMEVAVSFKFWRIFDSLLIGFKQQLSIWGEACDDDVSDVTDKLGVLIYEIGELEDQYIDRYDQYRVTIKSIRNIEASVQPSRDSKLHHGIIASSTNHVDRQAKDHRSNRPAQVQRAKLPQDRRSRARAGPCRGRVPGC